MSGQTQGVKSPPLRGYRRRKTVLDLNVPPIEGRDDEGTSTTRIEPPEGVQASHQRNGQGPSLPPPTIDVDAIDDDDDVIESSPRAFAQAKNNSRRAVVVDVESGGRFTHNKRRRVPPNQTIINCDLYINLEGGSSSSSSKRENVQTLPPKEPTFNCPICLCPLVEEMSTKCGHIFCKTCISDAIKRQAKCPTCRKRVTTKELIRVFLPATS
ncbi:PREDICTED: E3 ubiquitin-protein ligase RNF4 isoform X2 [Populus euphratica]|uniref:E3 ubiquitin-protein ligase RNF4 isoform X2 n=1 Tax=Populus euphratica TaxID=75702 RepID=A0AAJ6U8Q4_POPEU|nr:PREDICTED: E3 ubiquitin-protein ligase RNF4 isoform X2 [Populus euphratica]